METNIQPIKIKSESNIDDASSFEFEPESQLTNPHAPEEVASIGHSLPNAGNNETAYAQHELGDSFVIYELEPATAVATTTATLNATTTSHAGATKPPPTLLNAKFRKRARRDVETTTLEEPQKHVAMKTTFTSALTSTTSLSVPAAPAAASTTVTKSLKVKCFCRLRNPADDTAAPSNGQELKDFYAQMFAETRKLTHEHQRAVKKALLDAISQAEDDVDAGRFCDKCCS